MTARPFTVVKLGGSFAFSAELGPWLRALAGCAGQVVIVPGGGPFADAVRKAQPRMGFDDRAAHRMAMMSMAQYACAIASLDEAFVVVVSNAGIVRAGRSGRVPVWSPMPAALRTSDLPESWDVTSDSLAAWLAHRIGARRILLVKQAVPACDPVRVDDLVADGTLDPVFPALLQAHGVEAFIAGPAAAVAASAALRNGADPGVRITLS